MKFEKLTEEKQKAELDKVKEVFDSMELISKSIGEVPGYFGKYNLCSYVEHPAFMDGHAHIAMFDGITGKVKIDRRLVVCYGGLTFRGDTVEYDVEKNYDEICDDIHQLKLIVKALKPEPIKKNDEPLTNEP